MEKALEVLLQQSPSLAGLVLLAIGIWTIFKRNLEENRNNQESMKFMFEQHKSNVDEILARYLEMLDIQKKEIDKNRMTITSLLKANEELDKRYNGTKKEFSDIFIENRKLKRTLDSIEEMLKATGGDVKYIQKQLQHQREDIEAMNKQLKLEDLRFREE